MRDVREQRAGAAAGFTACEEKGEQVRSTAPKIQQAETSSQPRDPSCSFEAMREGLMIYLGLD